MRLLWLPFRLQISKFLNVTLPESLVILILQGPLKGRKWYIRSSNFEFALGTYEYELTKFIEENLDKSSVFYDIGAHVGYYSLLASVLTGKHGLVYSFEPMPRNIFFLKKHIEINSLNNSVVIEKAVSNEDGFSFFNNSDHISTGHLTKYSGNNIFRVETVSIDKLVKNKIIKPPDCIKIDVEGAELKVLEGASKTIEKYTPKIFIEIHSKQLLMECQNFLKEIGYKIETIGMKEKSTEQLFAYI